MSKSGTSAASFQVSHLTRGKIENQPQSQTIPRCQHRSTRGTYHLRLVLNSRTPRKESCCAIEAKSQFGLTCHQINCGTLKSHDQRYWAEAVCRPNKPAAKGAWICLSREKAHNQPIETSTTRNKLRMIRNSDRILYLNARPRARCYRGLCR